LKYIKKDIRISHLMKCLFCFCVFFVLTIQSITSYEKVLLRNINVLTFEKGEMTLGRRIRPILQLNCIGGTAQSESHSVQSVQCHNQGFNGRDYDWKCESSLKSNVKLGRVSVNCEGYDYPEDPYILAGSCGLEYTLEYLESHSKPVIVTTYESGNDFGVMTFIFFFILILFFLISIVTCINYSPTHVHTTHTIHNDHNPVRIPTEDYHRITPIAPSAPPAVVSGRTVHIHTPIVTPVITPVIPVPILNPTPTVIISSRPSDFAAGVAVGASLTPRHVTNIIHTAERPTMNGQATEDKKEQTSTAYGTTTRR
jgi:SOCE-associated regulatory factor of calcium homoeostasis